MAQDRALLGGSGIPPWVVNPSNAPDVMLDFAGNRAWRRSGGQSTASSLLTVSRASSGYVNDSAGNWTNVLSNLPRVSDKGLLVEEARTNLFLQSGTPATQTITVASGSTYAVSLVGIGSLTLSGALTGTVTQGNPVIGVAGSTSLTVTTTGITGSFVNVNVELGASVTSPILTTSAAVTRAADVVTLTSPPTFGAAYSLFAKGTPLAPVAFVTNRSIIAASDGAASNRVGMYQSSASTTLSTFCVSGSVSATGKPTDINSVWTQGASSKVAFALVNGDAGLAGNGAVSSGAISGIPSALLTQVHFGDNGTGTGQFNGFVEQASIWASQRVPNAQLQSMTQ